MLKRILIAALLWPLLALGQSYPSPTYNNLTVQGAFTATGKVTLASLATQAANTVVGNATGSVARPTAITVTGCNGAAQALQWTNGSGFGCNSGIATSGANANITSLSGLSTPLSVGQGGTGAATLTANGVLFGNGTSAVGATSVGTSGQVLMSNGTGVAPTFQAITGRLLNVQVFTSSGTYTPTTGTNSVVVEILGAGGGGGGAVASNGTNIGVSGCGGAGGYIKHRMTSGFSGATVVVGPAGTAGANTGGNGGTGGASSFGIFAAGGGVGGAGTTTASTGPANVSPVAGGSASGGNIVNVPGQAGQAGNFGASVNYAIWGQGGSSIYGSGAASVTSSTGANATGFGAGGGGLIQTSGGTTARTGGVGSPGLVIVWEYQ